MGKAQAIRIGSVLVSTEKMRYMMKVVRELELDSILIVHTMQVSRLGK